MSIELPVEVHRTRGEGGLTCYDITTPQCTGRVYALGATVTSFVPASGSDLLWVSAESAYRVGRSIRGGIPICAPWFGAGRGITPMPQAHGFVRDLEWNLSSAHTSDEAVVLVFELDHADFATAPGADLYPDDLRFSYRITFGKELNVELSISSPHSDVVLDTALHTYLRVADVHTSVVRGLDGEFYWDKAPQGRDQIQQGDLDFRGETDRVFRSHKTCVLDDGQRTITIAKSGSASTVIWNPWIDKAASMSEYGDDEWQEMVCVETANALSDSVALKAGQTMTMSATLSAE